MVSGGARIQEGMQVYDQNGTKLGTVGNIWTQTASTETGSSVGGDQVEGQSPASAPGVAVGISYFQVRRQGDKAEASVLYVPGAVVKSIDAGHSLTLTCAESECERQYARRPDSLKP